MSTALARYGLGAIITADEKPFVLATDRARDSLGRFIAMADRTPTSMAMMSASVNNASAVMRQGAAQISAGMQQLSSGARNVALGLAPLAIAVGIGFNQAAQFEKQMSAVGSITRATETDMAKLTDEAKRMGIISVFTATQAGEAMEYLGRAGANSTQIIDSLQGTMAAAAADSIDLATAADIVAQTVKSMALEWAEAGHVADVLALTSASTNTNIISLGESFKYGAAMAKGLDMSLEETSAVFGILANAGLRGTLAGTSFVNMMNKIVDPSEKTVEMMKKWNIVLTDTAGNLKPVSTIMNEFSTNLNKIPNDATRAALGIEFFGLRGVKAFNALRIQGKEAVDDLQAKLIASSYGIGAANEMAERRLDNFLGKLTLWKSSVESISIGIFEPMLKEFAVGMENMTNNLNDVLFSFNALAAIRAEESKQNSESAILLSKVTKERLQAAGATEEMSNATQSAIQVLGRMMMSEEDLSKAQIDARKRGVMATFESESRRRAELIKTAQLAAAGVASESQLGEARTKMMNQQISAMTDSRKAEAQKMVDLAFSGAKGAVEAQKWLRNRVLEEALIGNTDLSVAERNHQADLIAQQMQFDAERSRRADAIRAEIFGIETMQEIQEKYGSSAVAVALGMQDAIESVIDTWDKMTTKVRAFGEYLESEFGKEGLRTITKYAIQFGLVAAAVVPLVLALMGLNFVIGGAVKMLVGLKNIAMGVIMVIKGALSALATAFWPITIVLVALGVAFAFYRKEGESFGETMTRLWGDIKNAAIGFYTAVQTIISGFKTRWDEAVGGIKEKWQLLWVGVVTRVESAIEIIKGVFDRAFGQWFQGTDNMKMSWQSLGATIVNVIIFASDLAIGIIDTLVGFVTTAIGFIADVLEGPLTFVAALIGSVKNNISALADVFYETWNSIVSVFSGAVEDIKLMVNEISIAFFGSSQAASTSWAEAGLQIGSIIMAILHTIATVIKWVVNAVGGVITLVTNMIRITLAGAMRAFDDLISGITKVMEGDFLSGIKQIGIAIFNALTLPLRAALGALLKLVRKIPHVEEGLKFLGINIADIQGFIDNGIMQDNGKKGATNVPKMARVVADSTKKIKDNVNIPSPVESGLGKSGIAGEISDRKKLVDSIGDLKTQQQQKSMLPPEANVNVNLEDNRTLDIQNEMCVDGENLNVASARHKQEIHDRSGYKSTPWQRRQMVEHGASPVKRAS